MDPAQTGARHGAAAGADEAPPSTLLQGELRDSFLETPPAEKSPLGFAVLAMLAIALVAAAGWYFKWLPGSAPAMEAVAPNAAVPSVPLAAPSAVSAPSAPSAASTSPASPMSTARTEQAPLPQAASAASPAAAPAAVAALPAPASPSLAPLPRPEPQAATRVERLPPKPSPQGRPVAEAPWDPLRACANLDFGSMTSCWSEQCAGHPGDARCERLKADQQRRDATRKLLPPGVIDTPGG